MRSLILSLIVFCISFNLFSVDLTSSDISRIESGSYALRERSNLNSLELLPESDLKKDFIENLKQYNPEICMEMLYIIDKSSVENSDTVSLLNSLIAFSDQVGVEYFSNRRQAMHPLIDESYFVAKDGKTPVADPVFSTVGQIKNRVYYQKDTTFDGNYYNLQTKITQNTVWLQTENLEKLKVYKIFKALDKGGVRTNILVTTNNDKLYLYILAAIKEEPKLKKILTYEVNIPYSFERRMNSIALWYLDRL
ncbi:hypothetical protein EW093_13425 [Thiospirochaeta perfilievii]|uniref:Uncharacterized protein n=1 Tax=Thiospirochaeta perfilievii TaxID=252967 RepID=A0A5C1QE62_9SPIO|nr:DUF6675 family protein [Thiospirochaeta perfilievii]QEN05668.1 hypothetical protein EW093_13425 [Thiospirochaeta perfilievii]